jgi:hypothetical protein
VGRLRVTTAACLDAVAALARVAAEDLLRAEMPLCTGNPTHKVVSARGGGAQQGGSL